MIKRLTAMLLALALALSMVPFSAGAEEAVEKNLKYTVENGEATVTGYVHVAESLAIPETLGGCPVTAIGEGAFAYSGFSCIIVPKTASKIGDEAFYEARSTTVYLLAPELRFGSDPFWGVPVVYAYDVESVERIRGRLTAYSLEDYPCMPWLLNPVTEGSFTYALHKGEAILLSAEDAPSLRVPDTLGGCPVTRIAPLCFARMSSLRSLYLPDSVEYISRGAVYFSTLLNVLQLPQNLQYVGDYAFSYTDVPEGLFPDSLRHVGKEAFSHCNMTCLSFGPELESIGDRAFAVNPMTELTLPESVESLGLDITGASKVTVLSRTVSCSHSFESVSTIAAYAGSTAEAEAYRRGIDFQDLETGETVTTSYTTVVDGVGYRIMRDHAEVIHEGTSTTAEHLVLPETVEGKSLTAIGENAFCNREFQSVVLPDTVTEIRHYAFDSCQNLYSVVMSENLAYIEEEAFFRCKSLFTLYLPPSLTTYAPGADYYDNGIIYECSRPFYVVVQEGSAAERIARDGARTILPAREGYTYLSDDLGLYETDGITARLLVIHRPLRLSHEDLYTGADTIYGIPVTVVAGNLYHDIVTFESVALGNNIITVEAGAFSGTRLRYLYAGPNVQELPYPLFSENVVYSGDYGIYGYTGTYAEAFAQEHGYKFYPYDSTPFRDVPKSAWYHDTVTECYWMGLMNGTSETTFEPEGHTTRAMMAQVLYNMSGQPYIGWEYGFRDVYDEDWFSDAVNWCRYYGLAYGTSDTHFSPDRNVTREQVATFLYRYAKACGLDVSARQELSRYSDLNRLSGFALTAMEWAVATGIVTGNTSTTLNPTGYATRAEIATMLVRFIAWVRAQPGE